MQNSDVEEAIQKNRKIKLEIKKELEESIKNGKSNKNTEMLEKVNNITTREDTAKVVLTNKTNKQLSKSQELVTVSSVF